MINASRVDIHLADLTAFAAFRSINFLVCAGAPKLGQYKLHFVHLLFDPEKEIVLGNSTARKFPSANALICLAKIPKYGRINEISAEL